jgi:hypothetical protein
MRNARRYLEDIYAGELDEGSQCLMRFYAEIYRTLDGTSLLEFGGGPTLYSIVTAARYSGPIDFVDASEPCLGEVRSWLRGDTDSFDWSAFTAYALQCEGVLACAERLNKIAEREALIRHKVAYVGLCDAFADDMLLGACRGPYGAIASNFCLDGITDDLGTWTQLNQRLIKMLSADGLFVTAAVRRGQFWGAGGERYVAVPLTLGNLADLYASLGLVEVVSCEVDLTGRDGYDGLLMMAGRMSRA